MATEAAVTSDASGWEASIGEIVPLSTQLVSPAMAEAFGLPSQAGATPRPDRINTAAVGVQDSGSKQFPPATAHPFQEFRTKSLESFQNHFMDTRLNPPATEAQRPLLAGLYAGQTGHPTPYRQPGQQAPLGEAQLQKQFQSQPGVMGMAFPGMQGLYGMPSGGAEQSGVIGGYPAGAPAVFPNWLDQQQQVPPQPGAQSRQPAGPAQETQIGSDAENAEDQQARALKRPRLVWTAQLHQRFVDAVKQLGVKNAVPKTIMQLMNVDGLTRENVASHLQKYRLQLRKDEPMQEGAAGEEGGEDRDDGEENAAGDAEVPQG